MLRHVKLLSEILAFRQPHEPPEVGIVSDQAIHRMKDGHARNRERAVLAIENKNWIHDQKIDLEKKLAEFDDKIRRGEQGGDEEVVAMWKKERESWLRAFITTEEALKEAEKTSESFKRAIKQGDADVVQKTAEALAMKAQWKQLTLQKEMERQLRDRGFWELGQPDAPNYDPATLRELLIFLLLLVAGLLLVLVLKG